MGPLGIGLITTGANAILGAAGQAYSNYQNRKQAKDAQFFEQTENAKMLRYNSPASQIQRYRDAGLNPRLMYGSGGSASAGLQQTMPRAHVADVKNVASNVELPFLQMLTQYQDYKNKIETEGLIKNQKDLTFQKAISEGIAQALGGYNVKIRGIEAENKGEIVKTQLEMMQANINKMNNESRQLIWKYQEENPQLIKKLTAEANQAKTLDEYSEVLRSIGSNINDPKLYQLGLLIWNAIFGPKDEFGTSQGPLKLNFK